MIVTCEEIVEKNYVEILFWFLALFGWYLKLKKNSNFTESFGTSEWHILWEISLFCKSSEDFLSIWHQTLMGHVTTFTVENSTI